MWPWYAHHPCISAPLPACGLLGGIFLMLYLGKKKKKKSQGCKTNCSSEPGVLTPWSQHSSACQLGHQPTVTAQAGFKPWFLVDICSHLRTTEGNKNVSQSAVQVLLSMCFGLKPKCTQLFYQCLFLSFTSFISYPHQTCEHFEGWVTQIRLLSTVKSIIRQQNPLTLLLFRVPIQALTEKKGLNKGISLIILCPPSPRCWCLIQVPVGTRKENSEVLSL